MPIKIKDTGALADKFQKRAAAAAPEYKAGIADPARPQNSSAIAAREIWAQATADAASRDAFAKGLRIAGEEKWARKAASVGADRYPAGVRAAQQDWATGSEPYLAALRSADLPPRGLRRSPQNVARVVKVNDTLAAVKIARG